MAAGAAGVTAVYLAEEEYKYEVVQLQLLPGMVNIAPLIRMLK
jgi:hypothetical protein